MHYFLFVCLFVCLLHTVQVNLVYITFCLFTMYSTSQSCLHYDLFVCLLCTAQVNHVYITFCLLRTAQD